MGFIDTIKEYIKQHELLTNDGRYLVALSGGADSVCLLRVLLLLGYQVEAVHCNFHLRGEESNRDEDFVKALCKQHSIELHLIHFDTATYASLHQVSIEMAARELRYRYFEQLRQDTGAQGICVAHHEDDTVETVLMNLLRGTGIHGLTGIKPRNGNVLRPLLCVNRRNILYWLKEIGQDYVTDSSNLKDNVVRNKIRLHLVPLLHEINAGATDNILTTVRRLQEASRVYDDAIQQSLDRLILADSIEINRLMQEPSPESILFAWLSPRGFPPAVIEQVADMLAAPQAGAEWQSETHQMTISRGCLVVEEKRTNRPTLRLPETGTYIYDDDAKLRLRLLDGQHLDKRPCVASLDASTVRFPLTLRPTQQGDRFQPYGMTGTRLVSDYLTDRHLTIFEKRRTLVLCDADGRILWLVGHRTAAPFCLTPTTKRTLLIEWQHDA
ncbi:MAG: tRNA lysidine(34) synthetase TilS [Prevotella sp.]|nr:tRNA lysidine(34) synthetase TilS [Prevotella sp.]